MVKALFGKATSSQIQSVFVVIFVQVIFVGIVIIQIIIVEFFNVRDLPRYLVVFYLKCDDSRGPM